MERTVKKLYQGCIDLIDHDVRECIKKGENYKVIHDGKIMILTPEQLKKECVNVQNIASPKHGDKPYRLLSYKWNPEK